MSMDETTYPVIDRSAAKRAIMARMRDSRVQPDGYEAMRCTEHGNFIVWVSAPAPSCRVECPASCEL